uniref:Uncharacterized protein n=1 Tax=Nonomuraea gerenzanensis TaxID=93944 RepID=A0A1M4BKS7_9ACTN|nr:hypothetical protein BN4615_P11053 [Nonomuraea gerenzanensis]
MAADDLVVDDEGRTERSKHLGAGTRVDFQEGMKAADPKRTAVYFIKHGSFAAKEYQNCVPAEWTAPGDGPGRFWGYWKLERRTAAVELTPEQAVRAARIARRWARAQGTTRQAIVTRTQGGRPMQDRPDVMGLAGAQLLAADRRARRRRVRRRVKRFAHGRGFISVNNGQIFAVAMARALSLN